jgi:hypothetical protein
MVTDLVGALAHEAERGDHEAAKPRLNSEKHRYSAAVHHEHAGNRAHQRQRLSLLVRKRPEQEASPNAARI